MRPRLRHPAVTMLAALALGMLLAWLLAAFGPVPGSLRIPLPGFVARWLDAPEAREVVLSQPTALWLLPIAVLPFSFAVVRRSLVDLPRFQVALQTAARIAVVMAAALALSQPTLRRPAQAKSVVVAVDVSQSIDDAQLDAARAFVDEALAQVQRERRNDVVAADRLHLGLLTYASEPQIQVPGDDASAATLVRRDEGDLLASRHGAALHLAATMLDPAAEPHVVVLSDGAGSPSERADLRAAIGELTERGIAVHTRTFEAATTNDVLVEAVHLPAEMRLGQTFDVRIDVTSTLASEATLELHQNDGPNALEPVKTVSLRPGQQQLQMSARVTKAGPVVFEARLRDVAAAHNGEPRNDAAAAAGTVQGRPRILLVGRGHDAPLAQALRSDHLDVEVIAGPAVPREVEALRAYDLIVFNDIPAGVVPLEAQQAVERYVADHGGGFVMVGGEHSFGLGRWERTPIARVLPVEFEGERQREQPKLALVLVIDKSGSMSSEDKLDLVKEAARGTARTLEPTDELGVIAFDSRPHVLVRLQPASNRIRIAGDIRRLTSGGGTNALPALREAYLQLAGSNALVKHVIVLSDGQSPESGLQALLDDMRDADITVSAVGVGAGAGKDLLRRIADRGRGRYYFSHDGTDVPRIFSRETREVTRNAVAEQQHFARVAKPVQALRGIDFGGAPPLSGLVPIKPKPLSELVLRTSGGEPLLVRGRHGLGKTAAFASDAQARWAARWLAWSGFAKFWSQLGRDTLRQGATLLGGATLTVHATPETGSHRVVVDVEAGEGFANDLQGTVEVVDPRRTDDDAAKVPLRLVAPSRYEATVRGLAFGQHLLVAKLHEPAVPASSAPPRLVAEAMGSVSASYPPELRHRAQQQSPAWSDDATATREGPFEAVLEAQIDRRPQQRPQPLWPYVLAWLVFPLLLLDLALRRIALGRRRLG